jgi:hypothetical protein
MGAAGATPLGASSGFRTDIQNPRMENCVEGIRLERLRESTNGFPRWSVSKVTCAAARCGNRFRLCHY